MGQLKTINIPTELHKELKEMCELTNKSMSLLVSETIQEVLDDMKFELNKKSFVYYDFFGNRKEQLNRYKLRYNTSTRNVLSVSNSLSEYLIELINFFIKNESIENRLSIFNDVLDEYDVREGGTCKNNLPQYVLEEIDDLVAYCQVRDIEMILTLDMDDSPIKCDDIQLDNGHTLTNDGVFIWNSYYIKIVERVINEINTFDNINDFFKEMYGNLFMDENSKCIKRKEEFFSFGNKKRELNSL